MSRLGDIADGSGEQRNKYAQYTYLGAGTVVKVAHPAVSGGLNLVYDPDGDQSYGGFDNFGRVVDQTWEDDSSSDIDRYTYAYDRNSNRLYRYNWVEPTLSELYHPEEATFGTEYDGLNRLVEFHRGTLDGENDGISGNDGGAQAWTLDALGNWSEFKEDDDGTLDWDVLDQNRAHNKANEIDGNSGDPIWPEGSSGGWVDPKYDDAGNMIYGPRPGDETSTTEDLVMVYDAWNRLAAVYADDGTAAGEKDASDTLIAEYRYDGRHRRIAKIVPDAAHSGKYVRTDYYYSLGWQVVEERRDDDLASKDTVASTLKYQYVWGVRYIDAPVCRDEDTGDGSGGDPDGDCIDADDEHLYYTQDANFNVTALVDADDGDVVERYMYSPYGEVTVLHGTDDADGAVTEWDEDTGGSDWDNEILYCGYRFDNETGLYHVRHRYYHPPLGRWTSRDPSGYADGMGLQEYAASEPVGLLDPTGAQSESPNQLASVEGRMAQLVWLPNIEADARKDSDYTNASKANSKVQNILRTHVTSKHEGQKVTIGAIWPFVDRKGLFGQASLFYGYTIKVEVIRYNEKCYCDLSKSGFYFQAAIRYDGSIKKKFQHVVEVNRAAHRSLPTTQRQYVNVGAPMSLLEHERMHIEGTANLRKSAKGLPLYKGFHGVAADAIKKTREGFRRILARGYDTEEGARRACTSVLKQAFANRSSSLRDPEKYKEHSAFHYNPMDDPYTIPLITANPGAL